MKKQQNNGIMMRTSVTVPKELWHKICGLAKKESVTVSSLTVEALKEKYGTIEVKI